MTDDLPGPTYFSPANDAVWDCEFDGSHRIAVDSFGEVMFMPFGGASFEVTPGLWAALRAAVELAKERGVGLAEWP